MERTIPDNEIGQTFEPLLIWWLARRSGARRPFAPSNVCRHLLGRATREDLDLYFNCIFEDIKTLLEYHNQQAISPLFDSPKPVVEATPVVEDKTTMELQALFGLKAKTKRVE